MFIFIRTVMYMIDIHCLSNQILSVNVVVQISYQVLRKARKTVIQSI